MLLNAAAVYNSTPKVPPLSELARQVRERLVDARHDLA